MAKTTITIEPTGTKDLEVCPCCGNSSRCVWGLVYADGFCFGAYYVYWTLEHVSDRGAHFDMIIGKWGDGTVADDRRALSLEYHLTEVGPSFRVIDAADRSVSQSPLVGRALGRDEVIGTPLALGAFAIVDAILAQDSRVAELLGGGKILLPS